MSQICILYLSLVKVQSYMLIPLLIYAHKYYKLKMEQVQLNYIGLYKFYRAQLIRMLGKSVYK